MGSETHCHTTYSLLCWSWSFSQSESLDAWPYWNGHRSESLDKPEAIKIVTYVSCSLSAKLVSDMKVGRSWKRDWMLILTNMRLQIRPRRTQVHMYLLKELAWIQIQLLDCKESFFTISEFSCWFQKEAKVDISLSGRYNYHNLRWEPLYLWVQKFWKRRKRGIDNWHRERQGWAPVAA